MRDAAPRAAAAGAEAGWRLVPLAVVGYFALQAGLRAAAGGAVDLDEGEQLVAAQVLDWGYGPQPPLYTWLQSAVFALTGPGILGVALLKNALLALAYLGVWAAARAAGASARVAAVAVASTLLLPPLLWEAQRALSHSVLAVAATTWTVAVVVSLRRAPQAAGFAALGLLLAAGLLAKANVAFVAAGLATALLSEPRSRRSGYLLAVAVAAALLARPALWMLENREAALRHMRKFEIELADPVAAAGSGLGELATATLAFLALLAVAHGLLIWRRPAAETPDATADTARFLARAILASLLLVAVAVAASGTTTVKERWLIPILAPVPLAATLWAAGRIDRAAARRLAGLGAALALAAMVGLQVNLRLGDGDPSYQMAPVPEAARALPEGPRRVFASSSFIGGNLRLARPELAVLTPKMATLPVAAPDGRAPIAVWWEREAEGNPYGLFAALVARHTGVDLRALPVQTVEVAHPWPYAELPFRLHWAEVPAGACAPVIVSYAHFVEDGVVPPASELCISSPGRPGLARPD